MLPQVPVNFLFRSKVPASVSCSGQLSIVGGPGKIETVNHAIFGQGQSIEVTSDNAKGDHDTVMLFPKLPFALFRSSRTNATSESLVIKQHAAVSAQVSLGKPASGLRVLGTGGLVEPRRNPGSYVWMAVAEPESRNGVVAGWLTHERGSGVLLARETNEQVHLAAQIDYGRLRLASGKSENLETLAIGYFDDARLGLEQWADMVAQVYDVHLRPQPVGYCTWYSKPYGGASDEKHLAEQSAFAAKHLAPFGFSVIQIDDHWQAGVSTNGPKRNFTTHAPRGPYPGGMKAAAENVKSLGLVPGIWFMPFAGTYYDPFFAGHQDWFAKREDGQPYETAWGGTCLDMTHPGARDYLRSNIRRFAHDWGYTYFKMDGLWTGTATKQQYVNDSYKADGIGDAVLHNPEKTNIEAYRDGLKLVREAAGSNVFFLGCCSPQNMRSYGGAFGLVDAMRIGPDNGANWKSLLRGPSYGSRQYFLHGRVWYNDPDPIYVRPEVPLNQAQAICSWVTISGQLNLNSEWLPALPAERLDILKRTMPSHGLLPRPVDLFDSAIPKIWLLTDDRTNVRRDVVGLFNWSEKEEEFDCPMERMGLNSAADYVAFDYWNNVLLAPIKGRLRTKVPAQSCKVLSIRPASGQPQLISTSRHITQGIVDVVQEEWRAKEQVLQGRSKVVGQDPYEVRVSIPTGSRLTTQDVQVSTQDQDAGVRVNFTEQKGLLRATITSPTSREVSWSVLFRATQK